jgi:hypothetical protein
MPRKTAARAARRTKSTPQAPTAKQYRALEQRQGELIALQKETLAQLADALERIGILEESRAIKQPDERRVFITRAFRFDFHRPRPDDTDRLQRAVFSDAGVRWLRRLRLIPTPPPPALRDA